MLLQVQLLINQTTDDEAVEHGNGTALRGSEQAEAHTKDNAEGEEQTPEGNERLTQHFLDRGELIPGGGVIPLFGDDGHHDHHRDGHQNAGNVAGGKHTAQRGLSNQAENNQVDPGRNDGRGSRGRGGDSGGEGLGIAAALHLRNQHLGLHGAVGIGRAGATAHQHTQQHVDLGQTALHMTGDTFTEIHHFLTDTAKVHDGAGHDEKRNSQHGEGLSGVHDLLEDEPALGTGVKNQEIEEGSAEQRINYRKPQEIKDKHQDNGNDINECQGHQ